MDMYKCTKCHEDIKNDERDNHEINCIYTFSAQEYQDLIPCEICDNLINIEDYQDHITNCMNQGYIPQLSLPLPLQSGDNIDFVSIFRNILEHINIMTIKNTI